MPSLGQHQSNDFVKLLLLGDSKSGKTGSLVSLVKAGYKLRILDFDNLLDILRAKVEEECPDKIDNVEFRTLRDEYKASPGGTIINGKPKAWFDSIKMLNHWKYDDIDYGDPSEWGPDVILVIDSLTRWSDAAYALHETITPRGKSGDYDGRAVYGNAQKDIEKQLASLTGKSMKTNVIVICHGIYQESEEGTKIFPRSAGQKLSPNIPTYFPSYVRYRNQAGKRTIQLESSAMIDLANTNPTILKGTLPIETGLATIFAALRKQPQEPAKPKSVTLVKRA